MSEPLLRNEQRARPAEMLGRTIAGKFVIDAVVGTGAMGVVYRARQTSLDKVVAIKVMHVWLVSDPSFAARFHREAKAASRLDHPNSIRILDFGEEPDGRLYIAMDYLDGRDLLEVINEEWPLGTARTVDILSQALSALAVAHDLSVLHRDLKPENIMVLRGVSDDGNPGDIVKVCDFGIAKIIEKKSDDENESSVEKPKLSTGGTVVGTPAYMSPEQARGDELDARSDVYAMGVILYQMLTMRVPFDAPTPLSTLLRLVNEEAVPPSEVNASVDPVLEAVCLKAMAKKPDDRYPTAREMRAALRGIAPSDGRASSSGAIALAGARRSSPDASLRTTLPAPSNARIRSSAWTWVALLAALVAVGIAVLVARRPNPTSPSIVATTNETRQPNDLSPNADPGKGTADDLSPGAPPRDPPALPTATAPTNSEYAVAAKQRAPIAPRANDPRSGIGEATPSAALAKPTASASAATTAATRAPSESSSGALAVAAPRPLDPALVHVEIGTATHLIGTTGANVGKALGGVAAKIDACYRTVATRSGAPEGPTTLHVETNEDGVVTEARLEARMGASLANCVASAVRGRKIANVDTGSASADVPLVFRLR